MTTALETAQAPGKLLHRALSLYGGHFVVFLGIVACPIFGFLLPRVWRLRFKVLELRCPACRGGSYVVWERLF
ncbi:MAG TPA: hypothetical protein VN901_29955 [Candidatus Acidoferrales bacterium]|nr:hypothetical protein [Candidatus Acidoferrales bacterium]